MIARNYIAYLLPLARALGLFVLDFDVYLRSRDAEPTARLLVPALRRFFLSFSQQQLASR